MIMKTILRKYKHFDASLQELKSELGEDLYNVPDVTPEKISAADVIYAIKQYLAKSISLQKLVEWVNVVWFTDLYQYASKEENSISSVMTLLETLDEGVEFTTKDFAQMISCLEANKECEL
jgi:hypothetical protein